MNVFRAKKLFKICIIAILVFTLLSIPSFGDVQNVTVSVIPNPKIDVVISQRDTNADISNIKNDINDKLKADGFNTDNIVYQSIKTDFINTSSTDASDIFSKWTAYPMNKSNVKGVWYYNSSIGAIQSQINPAFDTGFINMQDSGYSKDITMESRIYGPQLSQPLGFIFRVKKTDANRYDMYAVWVSFNESNSQRSIAIFRINGMLLDYNLWPQASKDANTTNGRQAQGLYCSMPLLQYGNKFGYGHEEPNFGGYPEGTSSNIGVTAINLLDNSMKTTNLGYANTTNVNTTFNLKVSMIGSDITVYLDNQKILTASDDTIKGGYYGFFQISHVDPRFYALKAETTRYKSFQEVLHEPTWRDNAYHILMNVNDEVDETMTGADVAGENSMRLLNDKIHLLQWGRDANKESTINFINQMNDGNGMYTDNSNYQQAVTDTANYIENLVRQGTSSQYVIVRRRH